MLRRISLTVVVIILAGCVGATRGPIPETAWRADGSIDMSQVPDFIPAVGGDTNVGWIASRDVLPPPGDAPADVVTVYSDDLVTVVGHMHPGVGFVPTGAEGDLLEPAGADRRLTILVRNESDQAAILEIIEAPDEVDGPHFPIAPSIGLAAGEERMVDFVVLRDRWAVRLRGGDGGFLYSEALGDSGDGLVTISEDRTIALSQTP